ncbi:MAG TPA: CHAD domain-containing protein [Desulfuromonadales bacterium]|nr:CHAD domain-containing protein [Desulfuromonadales bacterium]
MYLSPDPAIILERSRGFLFAQWGELERLRREVQKSAEQDDIHDLRVASRRFRAALGLCRPFAPKSTIIALKKSIRIVTQALGALRNVDEALAFFRLHDSVDHSIDSQLYKALTVLRSKELKRIKKVFVAFKARELDHQVREIVARMNREQIAENNRFSLVAYFSDVSIRLFLPIHRLLAIATAPGNRSARHALRIAIKKWRYFFEIIAPILDRDNTPVLDLLKEYQTLLGSMNDIVEFEILLNKLKLPDHVRKSASVIFQTEDALLLEKFGALIEQKPLSYTFLI